MTKTKTKTKKPTRFSMNVTIEELDEIVRANPHPAPLLSKEELEALYQKAWGPGFTLK